MTKKAIVTLAIGRTYSERFEQFCRKSWTAYADRHGFDLFVIEEPLDSNPLTDYERVFWVDSDICINPASPSILEGVPTMRIGATDEHRFPTPGVRQALLRAVIASAPAQGDFNARYWQRWLDPGLWHAAWGLPSGQAHIVQTGVMVLSPNYRREVLEHTYHAYEDRGFNYEMRPLSHEIQARGLQHWIDPRFNALVWWMFLQANMGSGRIATQTEMRDFLMESYSRNYFLHFAGAANLMPLLGVGG